MGVKGYQTNSRLFSQSFHFRLAWLYMDRMKERISAVMVMIVALLLLITHLNTKNSKKEKSSKSIFSDS